jgi:outer membrane protein
MKMKKLIFVLAMMLSVATGYAQTEGTALKFGYLSYDAAIKAVPDYEEMQNNLATLRAQYEAEMKRVEDDFNKKYEEFLDGQAHFPKTILQKRQSELQEMLDKNTAFKRQGQALLNDAEASLRQKLQAALDAAITTVGQEGGYAFILNTDQHAAPFINPLMGEDVTQAVINALQNNN